MKAIYIKPIVDIILGIGIKTRISAITTSVQLCSGGPSQSNKARKKKPNKCWRERNKLLYFFANDLCM